MKVPNAALRRLYLNSGGRCSFPGCTVSESAGGSPILQIAYVTGFCPGSPRYDPTTTDEQKHSGDNVILLCQTHHMLVDKEPERYSAAWLRQARFDHENLIQRLTRHSSDEVPTASSSPPPPTTHDSRLTRLSELLTIWQQNRQNSQEEFWQRLLQDYPELLFWALGGRAYTIGGKCYVGGKRLDNTGGRVVDFLAHHRSSTAILEIKTPVAKLMTAPYRESVFNPTRELSGACMQVLDYKLTLIENSAALRIEAPSPLCFVLAGDTTQLSAEQRRSFELYRNALKDVTVMAFDELFDGIESCLNMLLG